jgi:hypothetical protein
MREYKIIVDMDQKQPFGCYERSIFGFFPSAWELIETIPSKEEALDYAQSKEGCFIGIFLKDGTRVALNDVVKMSKETTYTSEGLPVKKSSLKPIPNFDDDDATVLNKREVRSVKNKK